MCPTRPLGIVLFADVSGSTSCSPSSLFVARVLESVAFASLIINLLAPSEAAVDAHTGWLRSDPALLASRIIAAQRWLGGRPETQDLPLGLFAAGPASAAALLAARDEPAFRAIVCWPHGGRSAGSEGVRAPTLLIAGSESLEAVAELARRWFERHLMREWLPAHAP